MVKRTLVLGLVMFFLCSLCLRAEAKVIKLSYANFPPASTFPCVQMERFKQEVEKRTNGQVIIQTYPGGTLLGAKNMFRGVIAGQADIGCLVMSYQPGVFPLTTVCELPLGFKSAKVASMVLWEIFQKYHPKEFARVKVLTVFTSAPSNLMSKKPIKSLKDLKGVPIRAAGAAGKIVEILGGAPIALPMSETPEAIQKGVAKGLLTSFEVLKDLNFAAYLPYGTITNFQVYPFAVVMNKDKWNSLPEKIKKVFNELGKEQALWTGRYMDNHIQEALGYAKKKYGFKLFTLPQQDMDLAREKLKILIDNWKKRAETKGLPAEKILQDVYKFKAKYEQMGY